MPAKTNRRERGRPRDPETDRAILDAARRLMTERGYRGMSVDAIAAAAGVSKPTLYLRYPNKTDLATAAVAELRLTDLPAPTGDLRGDLIAQLRHFKRSIERTFGMSLIGTLLAEEAEHPELLAHFREQVIHLRRQALREVLQAAIERGDIPVDADLESAIDTLVGAYYAHYLAGKRYPRTWPRGVVELVTRGLGAR